MKKTLQTIMAAVFVCVFSQNALADKIVLLDNNQDALRARVDYIQNANHSISAQYFAIEKDLISQVALASLRDAANRGVKVRILVDSLYNRVLRETMAAVLLNLHPDKQKNIQIKEYNNFNLFRPFRYTMRMHEKSLIIDGKYMITGGRNTANGYYGEPNKTAKGAAFPVYADSDVLVLESKAIAVAAKYFAELWNSKFVKDVALYDYSVDSLSPGSCARKEEQASCDYYREQRVKIVAKEEKKLAGLIATYKNNELRISYETTDWEAKAIEVQAIDFLFDAVTKQKSNLKKTENNMATQLYSAISKAVDSVIIISPFLVITPQQATLFKLLKEKNVAVTIITNSKGSNNVLMAHVGYEKTRHLALALGITILEYQGPDMLHAKMVLIDSSTVFIGSFNWDFRSQNLNREVGILAELPEDKRHDLTNDFVAMFAKIMERACKVGATICDVSRGQTLEKLNPEEYAALVKAFKIREQKSGTLFRFLFPLIKRQL